MQKHLFCILLGITSNSSKVVKVHAVKISKIYMQGKHNIFTTMYNIYTTIYSSSLTHLSSCASLLCLGTYWLRHSKHAQSCSEDGCCYTKIKLQKIYFTRSAHCLLQKYVLLPDRVSRLMVLLLPRQRCCQLYVAKVGRVKPRAPLLDNPYNN